MILCKQVTSNSKIQFVSLALITSLFFVLFQILEKMKILEINLPENNDYTTIARMKRINFYCVKEDFVKAWSDHETFLVQYETKIKNDLMRQAKLSTFP